jgi:hypothetical protein
LLGFAGVKPLRTNLMRQQGGERDAGAVSTVPTGVKTKRPASTKKS